MQRPSNGCATHLPKSTDKRISQSLHCQWYLLGVSLCLMALTTSLRITLHLSEKQHVTRYQETILATAPLNLVQHYLHTTKLLNHHNTSLPNLANPRLVRPDDFIYEFRADQWDSAPIVIEQYKLIFFTIPKVACTTFKQLFRRMMHFHDWKSQDPTLILPHNPAANGLSYLWNYTLDEANHMMTSTEYTRAVFLRDPKARFLSAFLDKGMGQFGDFVRVKCCPTTGDCSNQAQTSQGFLQLIHKCSDPHWDPQSARMEPKYWKYINFFGHLEHLDLDGPALLKRIGAWEEYGLTGWGKDGNASLFQTNAVDQTHATDSSGKVWQWLTPSLERQIEAFYADDYKHPLFGFQRTNLTKDFWIKGTDKIYARGPWDGAPIVITKYKLIFYTIPRIGAMTWKQAFRRMEGFPDWNETGGSKGLPHDPTYNGLKYLYDFDAGDAENMIKDPSWTKAIFIQHPKSRFLEIYSHMSSHPEEIQKQCCSKDPGCERQGQSIIRLLDLSLRCKSDQWEPQSHRMEQKYWDFINFIGHMESVQEDAKRLLEYIGAWQDIGVSGWGVDGSEYIFARSVGDNKSITTAMVSYTAVVDALLGEIYKEDLENHYFGFPNW